MKYQIVIVKPPGEIHPECFREVAETLLYGLRRLGETALLSLNTLAPGAQHIFLGAHLLSARQCDMVPTGSILYNLEQIGGAPMPESYIELARRSDIRVWDYSAANVAEWYLRRVAAKVVPIGYVPELTRIYRVIGSSGHRAIEGQKHDAHDARDVCNPRNTRNIDVLFYGARNQRRSEVLKELTRRGLYVLAPYGDYGQVRDEMIGRAKVVLNVHFYKSRVFEIVRVSYLMANGVAVVTEDSVDLPEDLRLGLAVASYCGLVDACEAIVNSPERRHELEREAFACFSRRLEEGILRAALAA